MDYITIEKLKKNEFNFCKNWSHDILNIDNEFYTLINEDFKDDYFLNRSVIINERQFTEKSGYDISLTLTKLINYSKKRRFNLYLHVNDKLFAIKDELEKTCFKKVDKVIGLIYLNSDQSIRTLNTLEKPDHTYMNTQNILEIKTVNDLNEWLSVYSSSFKINEINLDYLLIQMLTKNFKNSRFIIYKKRIRKNNEYAKKAIGCCLLFPFKDTIGLYCLGTDKRFRNSGVASELVNFSIMYFKFFGFSFLGVQTLQSDNLLGFYEKRNFKKVYSNTVYSLSQ